MLTTRKSLIVGIGGTTTPGSTTEAALRVALAAAEAEGVSTRLFDGSALAALPHFARGAIESSVVARELVEAVRLADGLIIASPGYHGSISGLVKNGIDYLEETAKDGRMYLDGLPVGLVVTAYGWQATGSTLAALRSIVHALRGWPTPLGAAIKAAPGLFSEGCCADPEATVQLEKVGRQVVEFARSRTPLVLATA
jgi:FMN reductase